MTPTTEKIRLLSRKYKWSNRWMIIILLVVLLLTVTKVTPAFSSYTPSHGNLLVTPSRTPTAAATATGTRTPAATSTRTPTPAKTETPSPILQKTIVAAGEYVNLRTGPSIYFSKIRRLPYGEPMILLGRLSDNTWLYVKTSDGQEGWVNTAWANLTEVSLDYDGLPVKTSPPTETATPVILPGIEGRWIDIDISEQTLYAYEGTELVASFLVSTGIARYPTDPGQYHIDVKLRYSDMRGDDYFLPDVPYTMYYYGDFAIHGTYWHHSFGTPMSRGCVNMSISDAEWLFNWASVGTLVNIHR